MENNALLRLVNVTKRFPGVLALDKVNLEVRPGEVHGLVGENGAGKSTIIKAITGAHAPEEGEVWFNGQKLEQMSPHKSMEIGIACIYQELNQVPHMTVYENIFLGREEFAFKKIGWTDRALMRKEAVEAIKSLGLDLDPNAEVGTLGVGKQQLIEIARAVRTNAKLIIMDEPTAALSEREANQLIGIIKDLRKKGHTIIYVSHRLHEVKTVCDRITVLRDGKTVETRDMGATTIDDIVKLMVGREITNKYPKIKVDIGGEMLRVEGLTRRGVINNISFNVRSGEVLGFAGLVGSGRTETMRALTGADPIDGGKIFVGGKEVRIKNPRDSINAGIAFLTEDRKGQGLVLIQTIEFNSTLVNLKNFPKTGPLLNLKFLQKIAQEKVDELRTRTPSVRQAAGNLSGGNQQKVVIAKWLLSKSKVFIIDEPTRGIDVGAKVEVYNLVNELVKQGAAVIMVSSEMDECIGMSDRIMVMYEGKVTAELKGSEISQEKIMFAASGLNEQKEAA